MTPKRSEIFRAFVRGKSVAQIAESAGVSHAQAWSQLRRAVAELDRKGGSALDAVRWHNYLMLMRIVDQAFAAFEKSAEEGMREITSQTIESANDRGKLGLSGSRVIHHVRKDAGDVRYLEVAMNALREVRDLFKIGAEAESELRAGSSQCGLALEHLMRTGAVRLATRWAEPAESGTQSRRPLGVS